MRIAECSGTGRAREAPKRRVGARTLAALAALAVVGAGAAARAQLTQQPNPMAPPPLRVQAPGDALPPPLLARAASADPGVRLAALPSLQATGTPAAWNIIVVMLQRDLDARVRLAAATALGTSQDPELAAVLRFAAAGDPSPEVRAAAGQSLQAVLPFGKRVKLAAGLSMLCPGCGYFYLGDPARAGAFLGAAAGLLASGLLVVDQSPIDPATGDHTDGRGTPLLMAAQNLWLYGVYATYRDARLARGDAGYKYPVAREELPELLVAPFNPAVLKSPWVWGGIPLMLGAALGFSYLVSGYLGTDEGNVMRSLGDPGGVRFFGRQYGTAAGVTLGEAYNLSLYLPVGIGEEALFRGVVQAGLSETSLGLWGGWAVGSMIFGGIHLFNFIGEEGGAKTAAVAVPYLMATGSYLGFLYIKSEFSLLQGTAVHFWYDFLLSTIDFIVDPDHQPFVMRFAMPL